MRPYRPASPTGASMRSGARQWSRAWTDVVAISGCILLASLFSGANTLGRGIAGGVRPRYPRATDRGHDLRRRPVSEDPYVLLVHSQARRPPAGGRPL